MSVPADAADPPVDPSFSDPHACQFPETAVENGTLRRCGQTFTCSGCDRTWRIEWHCRRAAAPEAVWVSFEEPAVAQSDPTNGGQS